MLDLIVSIDHSDFLQVNFDARVLSKFRRGGALQFRPDRRPRRVITSR